MDDRLPFWMTCGKTFVEEKNKMTQLEEYYNKFNEEKRLDSRHGRVEFTTSMHYIHQCLHELEEEGQPAKLRILDIGAGTGRYSVPLSQEGYDVTAVELVKHNLGRLRQKDSNVKAYQGNALRLKRFADDSFDLTLLFGPMYHLHSEEDKLTALLEAKRVTRPGGRILVAYIMNEFSVITYAFKERHIMEALQKGMLDQSYHCTSKANELYSMVRLEDIEALDQKAELTRIRIIAADGAANYMRPFLNALTEAEFEEFIRYHLSTCERMDLMGASGHTVDILTKSGKR
jgi:ubiquinone/menaquinone biosynthesis C-methylase UbiE